MTEIIIPTLEECVLDPRAELPEEPRYRIPDAFEPMWFTYRRPKVPMAPHHLHIYHALSENQTLVYHYERLKDLNKDELDNAARVVNIQREKINENRSRTTAHLRDYLRLVMDNTIQSHPLNMEAREKILSWCKNTGCGRGDLSDAVYFPHIKGPPSKPFMAFTASFAQFYFMNEFFESEVGDKLTAGLVDPEQKTMAIVVPRQKTSQQRLAEATNKITDRKIN